MLAAERDGCFIVGVPSLSTSIFLPQGAGLHLPYRLSRSPIYAAVISSLPLVAGAPCAVMATIGPEPPLQQGLLSRPLPRYIHRSLDLEHRDA
jgi:hypothetical protein